MSSTIAVDTTTLSGTGGADTLAISEVTAKTGVTEHTLRYYERIGLLAVGRDTGGRRRYTEQDVARVVFVSRLRSSEMPIRDLLHYVELVNAGPSTEPQRLALLQAHRARVIERQTELEAALRIIDFKIDVYGGACGT
jgi:DNA-binding transcriptional MerR regulator